jgi:DNA-directed RNA polymerase specialized sigma24 family protein
MPVRDTLREERVLTQFAFSRLLEWLDDGVDSQGEKYLEMRRRLVLYFDRRNRLSPDDLADEVFNRIARTLEEDGTIAITPPARYCYVVARFVLLEDLRRREHKNVPLDEPRGAVALAGPSVSLHEPEDTRAIQEQRLDCLERCLQQLPAAQRDLIVEYYRDERREKIERRRDMAKRLGISMNALGIRASRIRDTLEAGVEACCRER